MINHSLGRLAIAWIRHFAAAAVGDKLTGLQKSCIMDAYSVGADGRNRHRSYDSMTFSGTTAGRPALDIIAGIALFEALGPARYTGRIAQGTEVYEDPWGRGFVHRYLPGEPIGEPVKSPFVHCLAEQRSVTWERILDVIAPGLPPLGDLPGLGHDRGILLLPGGGQIRHTTAAGRSLDGGRETFVVLEGLDHTASERLLRHFRVAKRNTVKRPATGSWYAQVEMVADPGGDPPGPHRSLTMRST